MLIDWLAIFVYLAILVSWVPFTWARSLLELGVFLISAILIIRQIIRKTPITFSADTLLLVAIALFGPFQLASGNTVNRFDTWAATLYWLTLPLIYLSARTLLAHGEARARFLSVQVWIATLLAIVSVILKFSSPLKIFGIFPSAYVSFGPFIYKNHFAAFLELVLPIAFFEMVKPSRRRLLYGALFAALLACTMASLSRAGVAIAAVEVIALVILSWTQGLVSWRTLRNVGLPVILLVAVFTSMIGWGDMLGRFQESSTYDVRWQLAASTIEMIKAHPLTGYGLGTWRTVYPQFANFDIARVANEAHDDWLQWASEGGIPFAVLILCFAVWVSRYAYKHVWGLGVPALFLHCALDYPARHYGIAALLFLLAGALASTQVEKRNRERADRRDPEWQILSMRTAEE